MPTAAQLAKWAKIDARRERIVKKCVDEMIASSSKQRERRGLLAAQKYSRTLKTS